MLPGPLAGTRGPAVRRRRRERTEGREKRGATRGWELGVPPGATEEAERRKNLKNKSDVKVTRNEIIVFLIDNDPRFRIIPIGPFLLDAVFDSYQHAL